MIWAWVSLALAGEAWWAPHARDLSRLEPGPEVASALEVALDQVEDGQAALLARGLRVNEELAKVPPVTREARRRLLRTVFEAPTNEAFQAILQEIEAGPSKELPVGFPEQLGAMPRAERAGYLQAVRGQYVVATALEPLVGIDLSGSAEDLAGRVRERLGLAPAPAIEQQMMSLARELAEADEPLVVLMQRRESLGEAGRRRADAAVGVVAAFLEEPAERRLEVFRVAFGPDAVAREALLASRRAHSESSGAVEGPALPPKAPASPVVDEERAHLIRRFRQERLTYGVEQKTKYRPQRVSHGGVVVDVIQEYVVDVFVIRRGGVEVDGEAWAEFEPAITDWVERHRRKLRNIGHGTLALAVGSALLSGFGIAHYDRNPDQGVGVTLGTVGGILALGAGTTAGISYGVRPNVTQDWFYNKTGRTHDDLLDYMDAYNHRLAQELGLTALEELSAGPAGSNRDWRSSPAGASR